MSKRALVTGYTGQDGSYMADLLLSKGYEVHGLVRRSASPNHWRIKHLEGKVNIVYGDLNDQSSLDNAIRTIHPDEVYNLGAQSFVQYSFQAPLATIEASGVGVIKLLEAVKNNHKEARIFQASTSEMFGKVRETPQKETTHFYPRSPYGCAKAMAHYACVNYREAYGMHISCGIMFNHESPRRGEEFVTRKITKGIAEFKKSGKKLSLGNLNASRDWGHAASYMLGAWLMLQQDKPDDYVLSTGETHTVKEWLEETCSVAGVEFFEAYTQNPAFERQAEVDYLKGDSTKARKVLGWNSGPSFKEIVEEMVKADEALISNPSQV